MSVSIFILVLMSLLAAYESLYSPCLTCLPILNKIYYNNTPPLCGWFRLTKCLHLLVLSGSMGHNTIVFGEMVHTLYFHLPVFNMNIAFGAYSFLDLFRQ